MASHYVLKYIYIGIIIISSMNTTYHSSKYTYFVSWRYTLHSIMWHKGNKHITIIKQCYQQGSKHHGINHLYLSSGILCSYACTYLTYLTPSLHLCTYASMYGHIQMGVHVFIQAFKHI